MSITLLINVLCGFDRVVGRKGVNLKETFFPQLCVVYKYVGGNCGNY